MVLAKFATFGTGQNARPGIEKTIAKLTGVGPRRVKFALRILEFHGVIRETHKARRDRSTTYRVVIGRAGADRDETPEERAAAETEARRVQVVRATYVEALKRRHGHDEFPKPVSVKAWVCRIEPIAKLAESAGLSFDQAAAAVWREYMREDGHEDGKLVARCHPPTWLSGYLPAIIERITKRAASDALRRAERPAEEPPPVSHQTYADGAAAALAAIGVGSAHERSPERRRS